MSLEYLLSTFVNDTSINKKKGVSEEGRKQERKKMVKEGSKNRRKKMRNEERGRKEGTVQKKEGMVGKRSEW